MAIKRYVATKDTTITNAFMSNLTKRGTKANMGESDVLEVFSLFGQANLTSSELSRILIDFPVSQIIQDRNNLLLPQSGNVQFILKLSNAEHGYTTPKKFNLSIFPLSSSWQEGNGLDMENYTDLDTANWLSSSSSTAWLSPGSDYLSGTEIQNYFEKGIEDLEVDITSIVESWITGSLQPNGLLIKLPNSLETEANTYYTKKFFSRGSQYFFKKPWIEARFNNAISDDRNYFYNSSSLAPEQENINKIYLYNRHRGNLIDIGNLTGSLYCSVYTGTLGPSGNPLILENSPSNDSYIQASRIRKGIYEAQIVIKTDAGYVFDVWHDGNGTYFYTGSAITIKNSDGDDEEDNQIPDYSLNITNLKSVYSSKEQARLNLYIRNKNWDPTIYTVARSNAENHTVRNAYYKIFRVIDNLTVIPYGTGTLEYTKLSYDGKGNYFDLDMSILEPGYTYGIKFLFKEFDLQQEQREIFKFRVEE